MFGKFNSTYPNKVIRGLRNHRPRMVASCDQYEFCYRVLEESLWGDVAKSMTTNVPSNGVQPVKKSKFKLFRRKRYIQSLVITSYVVIITVYRK